MTRGRPDLAGAAAALVLGAVGLFAVTQSLGMTMLGAIFPRTVGGLLMALAALQVVLALAGRGGPTGGEGADTSWDGLGRRLSLAAVMLAWALLFPLIGFVVTSAAAAIALVFIASHDRVAPAALALRLAAVLVMVGVFYWLMTRILFIPMPSSWLF